MIVGISVVKDEADMIGRVVRHMLEQVDHVIVADNRSTDGTREILTDLGVEVVDDPEPGHYQAEKMNGLAERARGQGAEWVVPFDADELWYSRIGRLGDTLAALPRSILLAQAELYDHRPTKHDGDGDPASRMHWRCPQPTSFRKVACRARPGIGITQGNHTAGYEGVQFAPAALDLLLIRHYPYRSPEQFISKVRNGAAAYAATDLPEHMGAHKRGWGKLTDGELTETFYRDFYSEDPEADPALIFDPAP